MPFDPDGEAIMTRRAALIRAAMASAGVAAVAAGARADAGDQVPEAAEPGPEETAEGSETVEPEPEVCLSPPPEANVCLCAGSGEEGASWLVVPAAAVVIARGVTRRRE